MCRGKFDHAAFEWQAVGDLGTSLVLLRQHWAGRGRSRGGLGAVLGGLGMVLVSPSSPSGLVTSAPGSPFISIFTPFFAFSKSSETTTGVGPERFSAARAPGLVGLKAHKTASSDPMATQAGIKTC